MDDPLKKDEVPKRLVNFIFNDTHVSILWKRKHWTIRQMKTGLRQKIENMSEYFLLLIIKVYPGNICSCVIQK